MAYSSIKTKKKKTGTRYEVYSGFAQQTRSGLTKKDLQKQNGVVYSKKELEKKKEQKVKLKKKLDIEKWKIQQMQNVQNPTRPIIKTKPKKISWADIMDELDSK